MKFFAMAFVLACEILITQPTRTITLRQVNEVRTHKSWRELGDTCDIRLAKKVTVDGIQTSTIEKFIAPGDAISVKCWYVGLPIHEEFNGYIRRLKPNTPFEIECEDHIYYLRKTPIKKSWSKADKVTLKTVVQYLIHEVNKAFPVATITLSSALPDGTVDGGLTIIAGSTAATALQEIKENFGLVSYFKGRELFTGLAYQLVFGTVKYSLAWNIQFHELTYRNADDVLMKVKVVSMLANNKKVIVDDVGDVDGEQRTIHIQNITNKDQLRKLGLEELKKYKFTGFEGDLTTFLYPYAEPLMIADLRDPNYDESRAGRYVIDSVQMEFGVYGATRRVELGVKLTV